MDYDHKSQAGLGAPLFSLGRRGTTYNDFNPLPFDLWGCRCKNSAILTLWLSVPRFLAARARVWPSLAILKCTWNVHPCGLNCHRIRTDSMKKKCVFFLLWINIVSHNMKTTCLLLYWSLWWHHALTCQDRDEGEVWDWPAWPGATWQRLLRDVVEWSVCGLVASY